MPLQKSWGHSRRQGVTAGRAFPLTHMALTHPMTSEPGHGTLTDQEHFTVESDKGYEDLPGITGKPVETGGMESRLWPTSLALILL